MKTHSVCIVCNRPSTEAPLIAFEYNNESYTICLQHLPILIHDPGSLAKKLPGAEKISASRHKD